MLKYGTNGKKEGEEMVRWLVGKCHLALSLDEVAAVRDLVL
jgi:hypothetical protein